MYLYVLISLSLYIYKMLLLCDVKTIKRATFTMLEVKHAHAPNIQIVSVKIYNGKI